MVFSRRQTEKTSFKAFGPSNKIKTKDNKVIKDKISGLHNLIITYNLYKEVSDKIGKNIKQERLENYFIKSNYCVFFFFLILCTVQS